MKLYWRYKKDGKWTWKPVSKDFVRLNAEQICSESMNCRFPEGEEE